MDFSYLDSKFNRILTDMAHRIERATDDTERKELCRTYETIKIQFDEMECDECDQQVADDDAFCEREAKR